MSSVAKVPGESGILSQHLMKRYKLFFYSFQNDTCVQCEVSPSHEPEIVPFSVSLIGDFTDIKNSVPFRYYLEPKITWIYPRYGPKNGGTFVEVFGENFLNFDQNLRCGFGSKETKAYFISDTYLICQ